ncbi:MAG: signal peptide peptidase SppA [Desulfovibrio sp.]
MIQAMKAKRAVAALTSEVWALDMNKFEQIASLAELLITNQSTDSSVFSQMSHETEEAEPRPYFVAENGIAILSVDGVIARRMNLFQSFSGGCSTELLSKHVRMATDDPAVAAILLDINSPGGGVFGLDALSACIRAAREEKPVIAFTAEQMCSAAYWIGSAANEIICSVDAAVGSVGVATMHFDRSGQDEQSGIKRTVISQGEYKRITSDEKPLSAEGTAYLQQQVDHYYTLFVEAVAENRGMSVDDVLKNLADGSIHIGSDALERGFVHHVGNLEFAMQRALELAESPTSINSTKETDMSKPGALGSGSTASAGSVPQDFSTLTADQLKQSAPELAAELIAEGTTAERSRIVELLEVKADPELTMAAVKDGTDPKIFYKQIFAAEHSGRDVALKAYEERLSGSAGHDGKNTSEADGSDFDAMVQEEMKTAACTKGKATLTIAQKHPKAHALWLQSKNE